MGNEAAVQIEMINNGGPIADLLLKNNMNVNALRPFVAEDGRSYINCVNNDGSLGTQPVTNATLRKDEWILLDKVVTQAATQRQRVVASLRNRGLTFPLPNGMNHTILQYQNQSDTSAAQVTMDAITKGTADRPQFDLTSLPLPLVTKDFDFTARELATSRNMGLPLDTMQAAVSSRRCMEMVEQMMPGTATALAFGGGTVFGLTNYTYRHTKSLVSWLGSTKTTVQIITDVLAMKQTFISDRMFGPYALYVSSDYETLLDKDYLPSTTTPTSSDTLRSRLLKIDGIAEVTTLDFLGTETVILVQLTNDCIELIDGFMPTLIQWQPEPMRYCFKIITLLVPRIRSDYNNRCGIVHAAV